MKEIVCCGGVEEGEIHIVAHGSSSLSDQACIIPERFAELDRLCEVGSGLYYT